jgi:transcriptional regulator with XRE-family HTH domain
MQDTNIKAQASELLTKVKQVGLTQEHLATALSVSQSQISRVLSGKGKRQTKLFDELCIYVNSQVKGISPDLVRENAVLLEAIASIWDGSVAQAHSIATVIRSLGSFCKTTTLSKPSSILKEVSE